MGRPRMLQHLLGMIDYHMLDEADWLVVPNAIRFHDDKAGPVLELNCSTRQAEAWCRAFGVTPVVEATGVWHEEPIVRHGWRVTIVGYDSVIVHRFTHPSLNA